MDWVGASHNKFLVLFAQELAAHGRPSGGLCAGVVKVIMAHPELLGPNGDAVKSMSGASDRIREACLRPIKAGRTTSSVQPAALHMSPPQSSLSPAAAALVNQVETVTNEYTDAGSFNTALSSVVDQAGTLPDTLEAQLVEGGASIAQSSMEYWTNSGNQAYEANNFYATYGDRIQANANGDPFIGCGIDSTTTYGASLRRSTPRASRLSLAAYTPMMPCGRIKWLEVPAADVVGFFGTAGALWVAGPVIDLAVATGGGAAASLGTQTILFTKLLWCIFILGSLPTVSWWL